MKVLIACEESQIECMAFRELGHEAYSCDIQEPSGGHPEWHILGDALKAVKGGVITTMDGVTHDVGKWDMMIAHPPCTRLCSSGQRWLYFGDVEYRRKKIAEQQKAIVFFMRLALCGIAKIAIENPIGIMSSAWRPPDFVYNPYDFKGETECKKTGIWIVGDLPPLKPTQKLPPELRTHGIWKGHFGNKKFSWNDPACARARSVTPCGVAKAMAEQWGGDIRKEERYE